MQSNIVLASTSLFRKALLEKLNISFETVSPNFEENQLENEKPIDLVQRLSLGKAKAVAKQYTNHLIIGSDQVACIEGEVLGKPGNFGKAMTQLQKASGKTVTFYTGLTLFNSKTNKDQTLCDEFKVHFRLLSDKQITHYLEKEEPYNCAGSFKSEGFGISLFKKLEGDDPNTLVGLPLIKLIEMFEHEGIMIP